MKMSVSKRHLDETEASEDETKRVKKTFDERQVVSCLESLSNELFYEIFDYLDGCQLYEAFSKLNIRFQNLINCSKLLIKICLDTGSTATFQKQISQIVNPNRHRILSLRLSDSYTELGNLSLLMINSSFSRLESLVLNCIRLNELLTLLRSLISLPRLFSLTIDSLSPLEKITNIYQVIFNLPVLKYYKFSFYSSATQMSLSIAANKPFSKIEHLIMDHHCTFNELLIIISYTPELKRLKCTYIDSSNELIIEEAVKTIPSLTHLHIDKCDAKYDELEMFLRKISPNLQVLHLTCSRDVNYLDANRWERLISKNLIQLRILEFQYGETFDEEFEITQYHQLIKRFNSSFWVERQWLFRLHIDSSFWIGNVIVYSIAPYKKNGNYFHQNTDHNEHFIDGIGQSNICHGMTDNVQQLTTSSSMLSEMNQLNFIGYSFFSYDEICIKNIGLYLLTLQITFLHIERRQVFIGTLIDLLRYLPNLDTLVVPSLSMGTYRYLTADETRNLRVVSNTNKITKVKLHQMTDLAQGQFLLRLCPSIRYFEIDCTHGVTPETFIRFILMKNVKSIPYLSSLCLEIAETNENMQENVKKMIDMEQLCQNYAIKQIDNRIYFRWN